MATCPDGSDPLVWTDKVIFSECATEGGVAGWLAENQDKIDLEKLPTEAELTKKIFGKIT